MGAQQMMSLWRSTWYFLWRNLRTFPVCRSNQRPFRMSLPCGRDDAPATQCAHGMLGTIVGNSLITATAKHGRVIDFQETRRMKSMYRMLLAIAVCGTLTCGPACAQWGDLKGQFIYGSEGVKAPEMPKITPTKDEAFCGKHELKEEELIVNPSNRGIKNVILWLYQRRGAKQPALHPDYKQSANATITVNNMGCRFEPHITLLRTTQTLEIGNPDPIGHNTQVTTLMNPPINPIIPAGGKLDQKFPKAERLPSPMKCSIHPWMSAHLLVQDHPFMAVTDDDGKFEIKNLPAGKWTFKAWQEKGGFLKGATVDGKKQTWRSGSVTVSVAAGKATDQTFIVDPKTL